MNIKDAIAYSLLTLDYEKDDYHTPRIAGVVTSTNKKDDYVCYVGIANDEKLLVDKIPYGEAVFISTYGSQFYDPVDFDGQKQLMMLQNLFLMEVFLPITKKQ